MSGEELLLVKVFQDADKHKKIAAIIANHLRDGVDIRGHALNKVDLSGARSILDLGCGFGFFTEALKDRVHPEAKITGVDRFPEYEWFYFQSCETAGIKANFLNDGIKVIEKIEDNSFDLILCSYALYFFPEAIKHISRILKNDGVFIAITHAIPHMQEFTSYVRKVLKANGLIVTIDLPYESLISRFSDKNGPELLHSGFLSISEEKYTGHLEFGVGDQDALIDYFNFKHSFFIPEIIDPVDDLHNKVISSIKKDLNERQLIRITKNDIIFVCSGPINKPSS
jgi:SAM-dependent methyltransferase